MLGYIRDLESYFISCFPREQLKDVPSKLGTHLVNKEYLEATKLLMSALSVGDGALEGVEALRELKNELHHKKEVRMLLETFSA